MDFFARDQNEAEQCLGVPLGDLPSSSQPSVAQMPTALRPSAAPSVAPSVDGIDERLSETDTVSESYLDDAKIRRKDEFYKYAKGWPRFGAVQDGQHNAGMYRRFGNLIPRALLYKQGRLVNLQQQLEEYDNDPATDNMGLTAGQTHKVGQPYDRDHLDLIMEELEKELVRYSEMMLLDHNTQALISAYEEEVRVLYDRMAIEGIVGGAGAEAAYYLDDFVFTRPKLVHNGIRGLISSEHGQELARRIFSDRQLSSAGFSRVLQVLVVLYILFMLLTPAAIIYLRELDKAGSFGVVVAFSVVFCGSLVAADTSFERFLIGTCTYATILLTTLLQTQFVGRSSSP